MLYLCFVKSITMRKQIDGEGFAGFLYITNDPFKIHERNFRRRISVRPRVRQIGEIRRDSKAIRRSSDVH